MENRPARQFLPAFMVTKRSKNCANCAAPLSIIALLGGTADPPYLRGPAADRFDEAEHQRPGAFIRVETQPVDTLPPNRQCAQACSIAWTDDKGYIQSL